jgi:hypothetical protein
MKIKNIATRFTFAAIILLAGLGGSPAFGQTNADEIAQLKQRVSQLEKQVQEISQFLEPLKGQQSIIYNRRQALQEKLSQRLAQDRDKYTQDQVVDAEKLYRVISQKPGSPEASESFQTMLKKYPDMNRTGCALLYMAQRSQGEERVKYLQQCIAQYNDCIYGDSVQVGAYARFLLAREYSNKGERQQAEALSGEIKAKFPGAIDHGGNLLVDFPAVTTK